MHRVGEDDLRQIAPYGDFEFRAALSRVLAHPATPSITQEFFTGIPPEAIRRKAESLQTVRDFQTEFIDPLLKGLEKRTTSGITISGIAQRPKDRRFLYLSNHRDIILDPALFTDLMFRQGYDTPQICLGDNLLADPLATDLAKMNKGITVKRGLPPRELLRWSFVLSEWIRRTISENKDSVWIAQKQGRAKDGNDETHPGVIKMLALTGEGDFVQRLRELRIVPVAISYEYDPSDAEKAHELFLVETKGSYAKTPYDDFTAVIRGLRDFKGGIHIEIGEEITDVLDGAADLASKAAQVSYLTSQIDARIHKQYRNWPSNFIAHDLLYASSEMRRHYSEKQFHEFVNRMTKRLDGLKLSPPDYAGVKRHFLAMYANSVTNAQRHN